ncbi:MAG: rhomboid family intramembrane serine protease [Acidobacteria bacterium]|nr:rhomboid family intramembrane serine protease [Acidobacteriota bacterium]
MKWKVNRYSQGLHERLERIRNFFKSVTYKQKMCPACRALVDRNDRVCPFCGENTSAAPRGGATRVVSRVVPEQARYTTAILSINLVLYGLSLAASARRGGFDLNSLLGGIDPLTLVKLGAKYGPLIVDGDWWRFLTPIFLHGGIIHLAFNSIVLFDLGPAVEQIYGSHKYIVLYLLTGAAGFAVSFLWNPYSVSIGASGAVFGLIGAMIGYGQRHRSSFGESVKSMYVRWAIYGLIYGFIVPGVDNSAHLGGLGAGILFGFIVSDMPSITREQILFWKILRTIMIAAVIFGFVMLGMRQPQ